MTDVAFTSSQLGLAGSQLVQYIYLRRQIFRCNVGGVRGDLDPQRSLGL